MNSGWRTGEAMKSIPVFLLACAAALGQQPPAQPQKRDLKIEKLEEPTPPPKVEVPRSYAVVVGISHYQNLESKFQLQFPERDAQSINTILISPEGGNFKAENVHVLTGAKATLAGMRREIDTWLPSVAKQGDRVLIYFAGHGFIYQGKAYLAPYDIQMDKIGATGFPMDELGTAIGSKINATYKVLMTDACHSGAITPDETASLNTTLSNLHNSLFSLTASRDRESSFESPELEGGHGVFTYYVVQGLGGSADYDHDGLVTADELAEYVHTQVRDATGGKQNPTSDRGTFDPKMRLAYTPANAKPATPPAPQFGTLVFEANKDEVEVLVDGKSIGVISPGKPLTVPGLPPGQHTVQGLKMGYEPDGPRQETVYPGESSTVSIKILIPRRRKQAAMDLLKDGIQEYQKGYEEHYKKAAGLFEKALASEPTYSQAAFYLGLTYNALFDQEKAEQYYKQAIAIDPDYLEARANYGGMLLDVGNVDEAIRQFNTVLVREPKHADALTMLSQAYRFKALYPQSIESARSAITAAPRSAEPHLWLADSLRLSGKWQDAEPEYNQYLKLSDFDTKLTGQLNYYVLGSLFGMGRKKHAATQDIWKDLRSLAYFGICDCERKLARYDTAILYCQKSLSYDAKDPFAHYALGLAFMTQAVNTGSVAELTPAKQHFEQMIAINPDMDEVKIARQNIANIQKFLQAR
jgi:tetratricopeptide (TPR) repeat protein